MSESPFNISLLREKLVFQSESGPIATDADRKHIIRSNRVVLDLREGENHQHIVLRSQNMHTALYWSSYVLKRYYQEEIPLTYMNSSFWKDSWHESLSMYERHTNAELWAAAYINGHSIFKTVHSSFIDVIEKHALSNFKSYDSMFETVEAALKKSGQNIHLQHFSTLAATITDHGSVTRCGILDRAYRLGHTLSFSVERGQVQKRRVESVQAVGVHLEAMNLQFKAFDLQKKMRKKQIPKFGDDAAQIQGILQRLSDLEEIVSSLEKAYQVQYRPERPRFIVT